MSEINLKINGMKYGGWESANIDLSIESLSGTFQLILTDKFSSDSDPLDIKPEDVCELTINDTTLITGSVDAANLSIDASNHGLQIVGRDKSSGIIDASIINGTGQYKNLKLEQIVERICEPFGITVTTDVDTGNPFISFNVEQGSSAYESIQKLCYARQCLAMSDGLGGLLITRAGTEKIETNLVQGVNILTGTASYDYSNRFSKYIVKGQMQGNNDLSITSITSNIATIVDDGVKRYRPLVIVADGQASAKDCETRGKWELNTRKGKSRRFEIKVAGWTQPNGQLWPVNKLVFIDAADLKVYDNLLIAAVNYSIDSSGGEIATLTLTSPDAYLTIETKSIDADLNPYILDEAE